MNLFGRKKKTEPEVKTEPQEVIQVKNSSTGYVNYLFNVFGGDIANASISPTTAYKFFYKIGPLRSTVSKIANAVSDLPLIQRLESNTDIFSKDSDAIKLLNNPSPFTTKKKFIYNCTVSLMVTRELWVLARGLKNSVPSELVFIPPTAITMEMDTSSNWPTRVYTNINGERRWYDRVSDKGRFRYFDKSGLNELCPFISESNESGTDIFRGVSPLASIKDELLSYSSSIIGNSAMLENSINPSGLIAPKNDNYTQDQLDDLKESLDEHTGPNNRGKSLLIPMSIEAVFPQWAPKDMEYADLQKNVKMNIWNLYSMPFPIVSEGSQKYSNAEVGQVAFYDEAVNEIAGVLFDALKWILQTRTKLDGYIIGYDPFEIPALKRRAIAQMKDMMDSPLTLDEIRASGGYDKKPNGDVILVNSSKTTLDSVVSGAEFV